MEVYPEPPRFNREDLPECIRYVEELYRDAILGFEEDERKTKGLNEDYQKILDLQRDYSFELVNNDAFLDWTTSDWAESYEAQNNVNATEPILDWQMRNAFVSAPNGGNSKNLRTID